MDLHIYEASDDSYLYSRDSQADVNSRINLANCNDGGVIQRDVALLLVISVTIIKSELM